MTALSLTANLFDPTGAYAPDGAYLTAAKNILDLCDRHKAKATFFTVGKIALTAPWLVRDIAENGHEIAYLGRHNLPLCEEHPEIFQRETYVDKDRLEQLCAHQIIGYRAPYFSITLPTNWAIEKCGKLGFKYSSSTIPGHCARFKIPTAPQSPFLWSNGLVEIPASMAMVGGVSLPYLSGFCLRALSASFSINKAQSIADANARHVIMAVLSTYDFMNDMSFQRDRNLSYLNDRLRFALRTRVVRNLNQILPAFELTDPLGVLISDKNFKKGLPKF